MVPISRRFISTELFFLSCFRTDALIVSGNARPI